VIKAVLDTSVIAAAFLKPGGINHQVLRGLDAVTGSIYAGIY